MPTRREMLEQFVSADPSDSFSRYALALELEKEDRTQEAITQLQDLVGRDDTYLAAHYHLGRLLALTGHTDDARKAYLRGLAVATAASDQRTKSEIEEALAMLD